MGLDGIDPAWLLGGVLAGFLLLIWVISLRHSAQERKFTDKLKRQLPARGPERVADVALTVEGVGESSNMMMLLQRFRCGVPISEVLAEDVWNDAFGGKAGEVIGELKRLGLLTEMTESHAVQISFGSGDLKAIVRRLGLKVGGTKEELLLRIREAAPSELQLRRPLSEWLCASASAELLSARAQAREQARAHREWQEKRRNRMAEFKALGIERCELLPANVQGGCCAIAQAMSGRLLKVSDAPKLPLPGCDAEECLCDYIAVSDFEERLK